MARMVGAAQWNKECSYKCCRSMIPRGTAKAQEKVQWTKEAEDELYDERDEKHARGLCFDPKTKMYGCDYCYNGDEYYDASELDGIEGVWTDTARLTY